MKKLILLFFNLLLVASMVAQVSCPSDVTVDGITYSVVRMGNQCWTAQNMRHVHYADGTDITPAPMEYEMSDGTFLEPLVYGKLYVGSAALRNRQVAANGMVQGICPTGWHIPTTLEINELMTRYTPQQLMTSQAWIPEGGTDEADFHLLPTGYFNAAVPCFEGAFVTGVFWTTTPSTAVYHACQYGAACGTWEIVPGNPVYGYPVRCVRDVEATPDTITFVSNGATGGVMAKQMVTRGTATALSANQFTHDGNWEFIGWNDACDGTGTNYADGANITTNGNVTLYAQWHTWCTGTAKSNELGTSRIDSVKDHQDNWYKVVEIGTGANKQCWLKENMRATTSPKGNLNAGGSTTSDYKAYYYDYSTATQFSLRERGYLYNWAGAIDTNGTSIISASFTGRRGICPEGWHIPSNEEWMTMELAVAPDATYINPPTFDYQGASTDLAASLSGGCDWSGDGGTGKTPNSYSNPNRNSSGFSALPAGYYSGSSFNNAGYYASFWSATSIFGSSAYFRYLGNSNAGVLRYFYFKNFGFSVRCVRDVTGLTLGAITKTDSTANTLSISAAYTATQAVTSATICAYTDAECTYPAGTCATGVDYSTSPITGTVTGLTPNTQYYVKVTATTAGGSESAVAGPFGTKEVTMSIASNRTDTISRCGSLDTTVTYTATVIGDTPSSYSWKVNDVDSTSVTGNTLTVRYNTAASNKVVCTASGVSDTAQTVTKVGVVPTLLLCEECPEGSITVKTKTDVASIVWRNSDNDSVSNSTTALTLSASIPAGTYTATAKSSDGCTVSRTAVLREQNAVPHPCTVLSLRGNESGAGTRLDSVKDHQDNWYKVVQIGEGANAQCWLAENMRATTSPSTHSTIVLGNFSSFISSHHSKCAINHDSTRYGVLYNWCAAVDTFDADGGKPEVANETDFSGWNFALPAGNRRGICPEGWHIPTNNEWTSMASLAGVGQGSDTGVSKLSGGCDWPIKDDGTYPGSYADSERNSTGFSALPAGNKGGMRTYVGIMAFFWSATSNGQQAYARIINKDNQYLESQDETARYSALSVRCLRDNTGLTMGAVTKTDSTANTLSISAAYTATQTVTGATICAYTDAACTNPAGTCATVVDYASSPITGTITDLTGGTQYYVKVTATTAGGSESAVAGPFGTKAPTMSITSNPTSAKVCSGGSVQITFTATLNGATASSYSWSVSGGTGSSTTNTITVTATEVGSIDVSCTAAGVSAAKSTTVTAGTVPTLGLCEECFNDSIQVKVKTNVASIVWRNSSNDSISNSLTGLKKSATIPAGVYTAIAKSSDGCSVSRSAVLGNYVPHPCTVTATRDNEAGTATSIDSVKDHQNNWYKVVQIGEGADAQCWLAENMRATTSPSTHSTIVCGGASDYVSSYSSKCAIYHDDSKYGVLYNWCAAVDTFDANSSRPELANASGHNSSNWSVTMPAGNRRGICPEGWHIPTDAEWTSMDSLAGVGQGSGTGVSKLSGGCDWSSQSSGTYPGSYSVADRNSTGFSALPAGYCNSSSIGDIGTCAYFWSVTPNTSADAYNRYLYKERQFVYRYCYYRNYAFSVRCVRDVTGITLGAITKTDSTTTTLSISAAYSGDSTITSATICAYTNAACTTPAGTCATVVDYASSPITGTVTDLTGGTQYYVKVTATTAGGSESAVAGPFGTAPIIDTITFIPNGSANTMPKQLVPRGTATALNTNAFTHDGNWEFIGWSTNGTDSVAYTNQANITTNGNVTLYAQWHTWCTGTAKSNELGTSRIDSVKDHQDNWYKVVEIGSQCWMKENLRTTKYADNTTIALGTTYSYDVAYCYAPNDNNGNVATYGYLYNWKAVMRNSSSSATNPSNVQGVCPTGWHVPSDAEWTQLTDYVSSQSQYCCSSNTSYIAKALASTTGWASYSGSDTGYTCFPGYNSSGNNATGFSALPAGNYYGTYYYFGQYAYFWSATDPDSNSDFAYCRTLYSGHAKVYRNGNNKSDGCSVRCVRDRTTDTNCLAAGTRITMADGSYKNVENIAVGDLVRTFNHETGEISSAEICLAWKSDTTKQTLNLTFASGKTVGIVGKHDFLFENTRKYVRINQDNVAEYVGKRFYNAESGSWDALVSYEMGAAVNYYCPYTAKHLNCLAEGMLTCPDDVDYLLNIYELDANLKADSAQLAADIAQYGLCNVANDFPEFVQYKAQMDNLGAPYLYIAIGKGLVPRSIIDVIKSYWMGR